MVTISILGILASVILVSVNGARTKSRDNATYTQITSTQSLAFKCLTSGIANVELRRAPAPDTGRDICGASSAYGTWPALVASTGWAYGNGRFEWCSLVNGVSCNYQNGTCGGNRANGAFCYRFINSTDTNKRVTCTQNGCTKAGF